MGLPIARRDPHRRHAAGQAAAPEARAARHPADDARAAWRCCLASREAQTLFGALRRVVLDELHALVTSKRGDLLSLGLARLRALAPGLRRSASRRRCASPTSCGAGSWRRRHRDARMADSSPPTGGARPELDILRDRAAPALGGPHRPPRHGARSMTLIQRAQDDAGLRQHPHAGRIRLPGAVAAQRRQPADRAASRLARCRPAPQGRGRDGGGAAAGGGLHLDARSRHRLGRCRPRRQCRRAQGRDRG